MRVTLDTNALLNIYEGISIACFVNNDETVCVDMQPLPRSISVLKDNLACLIEYDSVIYKKNLTVFNSPFITSFSKDSKDIMNIDFSITGLLLIKKCLETRVELLWEQADESRDNKIMLNDIFENMTETESLIIQLDEFMMPLYN